MIAVALALEIFVCHAALASLHLRLSHGLEEFELVHCQSELSTGVCT
jgi:hypothetical protein